LCRKLYNDAYYQDNKDKILEYGKNYYSINKDDKIEYQKAYAEEHREEKSLYNKEYRETHAEELAAYNKEYALNNQEEISEYKKQYREDNKEYFTRYHAKYMKDRRSTDITFKLRSDVSCLIWHSLKGKKDNQSCITSLSYTIGQLKEHLEHQFEPWMTWQNWGRYDLEVWNDNDFTTWTWQIDHIVPQSTFQYSSMEEQAFKDCWALTNLRPLSAKQNYLDGMRRTRHKI
jgi:hypothetical protein